MTFEINVRDIPEGRPFSAELFYDSSTLTEAHRHEYFEIIWSPCDSGIHSIDYVQYPLTSSRIFLIAPGQVHESGRLDALTRLIIFKQDFAESMYRQQLTTQSVFAGSLAGQPYLDIDDEAKSDLGSLFSIMHRENSRNQPDWDLLTALLDSFLYYLARFAHHRRNEGGSFDQRILNLHQLIDQYFRSERTTGFYAVLLSLNGKRLNELTRKYLGKTVTTMIHERVLLEAQRELVFTTKTIKTIAYELGYEDPSYFCRFFRKLSGESPSSFRAKTFR